MHTVGPEATVQNFQTLGLMGHQSGLYTMTVIKMVHLVLLSKRLLFLAALCVFVAIEVC